MRLMDILLGIIVVAIITPVFLEGYAIAVKKVKGFDEAIKNHVNLLSSFKNLNNCQDIDVNFPGLTNNPVSISVCNKDDKIFTWLVK